MATSSAPPSPLSCRFVTDVTLPDGCKVPPNTPLIKVWMVQNDSKGARAERPISSRNTRVLWTRYNFDISESTSYVMTPSSVGPGETCEISVEFRSPAEPGRYSVTARLYDRVTNERFGDNLWFHFETVLGSVLPHSKCPRGHSMQRREGGSDKRLPPAYRQKHRYVNCDRCASAQINTHSFYDHCPICHHDLCTACARTALAGSRVAPIPRDGSSFPWRCTRCTFDNVPGSAEFNQFVCAMCGGCGNTSSVTRVNKGTNSSTNGVKHDEKDAKKNHPPKPRPPRAGLCALYANAGCVRGALVATKTEFYYYGCQGTRDHGWGCTYRVLQMIFSNLKCRLPGGGSGGGGGGSHLSVPSLRNIQTGMYEAKVFSRAIIGSRTWLEPWHCAMYLQHLSARAGPLRTLNINPFSATFDATKTEHRVWFEQRLWGHFAGTGSRTPVMLDNHVQTKGILGIGRCRDTNQVLILVFDPHVWKHSHDASTMEVKPASSSAERTACVREGLRKYVFWTSLRKYLDDIQVGKSWMVLFVTFSSQNGRDSSQNTREKGSILTVSSQAPPGAVEAPTLHVQSDGKSKRSSRRSLTPPAWTRLSPMHGAGLRPSPKQRAVASLDDQDESEDSGSDAKVKS